MKACDATVASVNISHSRIMPLIEGPKQCRRNLFATVAQYFMVKHHGLTVQMSSYVKLSESYIRRISMLKVA